jgi:asparagine synthetase B (glutamine-hydrolysing)
MPGIAGWLPVGERPRDGEAWTSGGLEAHEAGDRWTPVPVQAGGVAISVHAGRETETRVESVNEAQVTLAFSGELFEGSVDEIITAYLRGGEAAIERLDGSFVLYLSDGRTGSTLLATDYLGSRPMYYAPGADGIRFGPELGTLQGAAGQTPQFGRDAAVSFLIHGHLLADQAWLSDAHTIPPGSILRIESDGSTALRQYFELGPSRRAGPEQSDESTMRALEDLLRSAVARRWFGGEGLVLPLSGGIDSRGILGCLLEHGASRLKTVTWGVDDQTEGTDAWVAGRLAEQFGTEHTFLRRASTSVRDDIREMTRRIDATTDDSVMHPYELRIMRRIRDELGGLRLMRGDECFGFGGPAVSDEEAFARVGLSQLSASRAVQQLLPADHLDESIAASKALLDQIAGECVATDFTDRKDSFYATQRLRHYLNRSSYYKLTVLNLQNPWLDRRLLEFAWSLPARHRIDKQLFKRTLATMFPSLMSVPVATAHSLEDWGDEIRRRADLREYLHDRLVTGAGSLEGILDPASVSRFVSGVLAGERKDAEAAGGLAALKDFARKVLPAKAYSGLKTRFLAQGIQRPVRPAVLALRLLVLSEWVERAGEFERS